MIKRMIRLLAVSTLVLTGMVAVASAQDGVQTKKTKIEFDFYAGKKLMPAGEYIVKLLPNGQQHKLISIQEVGGDATAIVASIPNRNKTKLSPGSLAFNKYGDQYFLAGVQLGDDRLVHTIVKTSKEKAASKSVSADVSNQ